MKVLHRSPDAFQEIFFRDAHNLQMDGIGLKDIPQGLGIIAKSSSGQGLDSESDQGEEASKGSIAWRSDGIVLVQDGQSDGFLEMPLCQQPDACLTIVESP